MTPIDATETHDARRRGPLVLAALALLGLLLAILWIVAQARVADFAENTIRDHAGRFGFEELHLDVRQVTPWRTDVHGLRIGPSSNETHLQLDSLVLDYTPSGLKTHVIDGIQASGLVLKIERTTAGWRLAGLPPRLTAGRDGPPDDAGRETPPDWRTDHLAIRNSRLGIIYDGQRLDIPFGCQAQASDATRQHYRGRLVARLGPHAVTADFDLDLRQPALAAEVQAPRLDLGWLAQILTASSDAGPEGWLAASARARLNLAPLSLEHAEIAIRLPERITLGKDRYWQAIDPAEPLATAHLNAERNWRLQFPGLAFSPGAGALVHVVALEAQVAPTRGGWHWRGAFDLVQPTQERGPVTVPAATGANRMPCSYEGEYTADGRWSSTLSGQGRQWHLALNPTASQAGLIMPVSFVPRLDIEARGQADTGVIDGHLELSNFRAAHPQGQARLQLPQLTLQAAARGTWPQLEGDYAVAADGLRVDLKPLKARLPRVSLKGTFAVQDNQIRTTGRTRLSGGELRLPERNIRLAGLQLELPFAWPFEGAANRGRLKVAATTWGALDLGAIQGNIRQRGAGADFKLTQDSKVLAGGRSILDGRLRAGIAGMDPRLDLDFRFDRAVSPTDIDLGRLNKELSGIRVNGRLAARGKANYAAGRLQADLKLDLNGGRLMLPEQKAGMVGLQGTLVLPDLLAMRSAPRQAFSFERTFVGDIAATEGHLNIQIEPGGVFFLEEGRFQWCRGTVYLPATRVAPGKDDYDITLWCDRLKLAPLLEQLGAARAEGGGTVSGRIPIQIKGGQFRVNSGFLYSSPGEGGTIRLRGTDLLTAGMPPGTPQYNQLALARRALEEYDYEWVKLSLATAPREDLLRLKLQLNGRPSNPLPFIYDSQSGGFVPAAPGSPGSRFEEIKLDVNFSLPLNRLLEYKDLLKLFS